MVADAVAAAKLPVGVVVGHAPAKAARHARLGDAVVEHGGVVQCLHQTVGFVIKGLGGEVLPAELTDEVALAGVGGHGGAVLAACAAPGVGIIVVGVNILQQLAFAGAAAARCGAGGVQPVDRLVGALIKGFVVGAAADAGTPQKHAGVAAVLAHHLPAVLQRLRLPDLIADVLPAGHFGEHQQTQLIAGVQKCRAGGRIAGAHGVAAQFLFQQLSVQPLDAVRHGIALIGVTLVPVKAAQFHPLSVQVQPTRHELHRAETEPHRLFVQHPVGQAAGAGADEPHGQGVQGGVLQTPRVHIIQRAGDGQGKFAAVHCPAPGGAADLGLQGAADRLAHGGGVDAEIALRLCLDEHVPQVGRLLDIQTDGAVNATVGQRIQLPAEGRDVQILPAVAAHSHHVLLPQTQCAGQVYRKGGVAAAMVEQPPPVAEHGGVVRHCPEGKQHGAAQPLLGRKKLPPVAAQALVVVLAAIVIGQGLDRVRQPHRGKGKLRALRAHQRRVKGGGKQPALVPIVVFHSRISV